MAQEETGVGTKNGIAECEARVPVASAPALWPILMRQVAALFRFSDKPTRPSDDEGSRLTDPPFMGFRGWDRRSGLEAG